MTIGERIIEARVSAGMSQADLVRETGFSRQSVSAWENGHTQPEPESLIKLSQSLGVSTDYLLKQTDVAAVQR